MPDVLGRERARRRVGELGARGVPDRERRPRRNDRERRDELQPPRVEHDASSTSPIPSAIQAPRLKVK